MPLPFDEVGLYFIVLPLVAIVLGWIAVLAIVRWLERKRIAARNARLNAAARDWHYRRHGE